MSTRRNTARLRRRDLNFSIEGLERRDCPAIVSLIGPTEAAEAGAAVTFTATLSAPQPRPVEVTYFTAGSAAAGLDFRLTVGATGLRTPSGTFTFKPGVTSLPITFTPINDTAREGTETFQLSLASAPGHTLGAKTVSLALRDDDSYTAAIVGPARVQANTTTRFTLQLSSPATRSETFFVSTEDRSASTAPDYAPLRNLPITFSPGQRSRDFSIVTRPAGSIGFDRAFVINVTPQAKDVPAVAPFTVTIAANGTPLSTPAGPAITTATFTKDYGWGIVNASASVAKLLGRTTAFPEVPNIGGVSWGNDVVRAPEVWAQGYTGRGIVVAVVDSGVDYNHPSLRNSIWVNAREIPNDGIDNDNNGFVDDVRGWDFSQNDNEPMDDVRSPGGGHGTHVAGTIAAGRSDYGPQGVALDAKIMPVRIGPFMGQPTTISAAIRYAANNGANVINLSIKEFENIEIINAISFATSLGVVVVAAAGNDGLESPLFPAKLATMPGVISVGAIGSDLALAGFSHRAGLSPAIKQIVAPGVNVRSTVPVGYSGGVATPAGTFASLQGTSMATPHVAGVIALMLSALPNAKAPSVRDRVVNALVTTSQQPPAMSTSALAAAGTQTASGVSSAQRPTQPNQTGRVNQQPAKAFSQAEVTRPQLVASRDPEAARRSDAVRALAFRGLATTNAPSASSRLRSVVSGRRSI